MLACSVGHGENYSNCQQMLKGKLSITFLYISFCFVGYVCLYCNCQQMLKGKLSITFLYMLDMYVCIHIDIDVSMHECMHVLCSYMCRNHMLL